MSDMIVRELARETDVTSDAVRLKFIQRAKMLGYKLDEIRAILAAGDSGAPPCALVRKIIARRIKDHSKALDEAVALQERMEPAIRDWRELPDGIPTGDSVCYFIEQATADLQPMFLSRRLLGRPPPAARQRVRDDRAGSSKGLCGDDYRIAGM